eukprot:tig00021127_g18749.t1
MLALRSIARAASAARLAAPAHPRAVVVQPRRWSTAPPTGTPPPSGESGPSSSSARKDAVASKVRAMSPEEVLVLDTYSPRELLERGKRIMDEFKARGEKPPPQDVLFERMLHDIMLEHRRNPREIKLPKGIPMPGEMPPLPEGLETLTADTRFAKEVETRLQRALDLEMADMAKRKQAGGAVPASGPSAGGPASGPSAAPPSGEAGALGAAPPPDRELDEAFAKQMTKLLDQYEERFRKVNPERPGLDRWLSTLFFLSVCGFFLYDGFERWRKHELWKWHANNRIKELSEYAAGGQAAREEFLAGAPALARALAAEPSAERQEAILRAAIDRAFPPAPAPTPIPSLDASAPPSPPAPSPPAPAPSSAAPPARAS